MVEADSGFITEVPGMGGPPDNDQQVAQRDVDNSDDEEQFSQDEDEKEDNQYF